MNVDAGIGEEIPDSGLTFGPEGDVITNLFSSHSSIG
jgi:hypothetical protein